MSTPAATAPVTAIARIARAARAPVHMETRHRAMAAPEYREYHTEHALPLAREVPARSSTPSAAGRAGMYWDLVDVAAAATAKSPNGVLDACAAFIEVLARHTLDGALGGEAVFVASAHGVALSQHVALLARVLHEPLEMSLLLDTLRAPFTTDASAGAVYIGALWCFLAAHRTLVVDVPEDADSARPPAPVIRSVEHAVLARVRAALHVRVCSAAAWLAEVDEAELEAAQAANLLGGSSGFVTRARTALLLQLVYLLMCRCGPQTAAVRAALHGALVEVIAPARLRLLLRVAPLACFGTVQLVCAGKFRADLPAAVPGVDAEDRALIFALITAFSGSLPVSHRALWTPLHAATLLAIEWALFSRVAALRASHTTASGVFYAASERLCERVAEFLPEALEFTAPDYGLAQLYDCLLAGVVYSLERTRFTNLPRLTSAHMLTFARFLSANLYARLPTLRRAVPMRGWLHLGLDLLQSLLQDLPADAELTATLRGVFKEVDAGLRQIPARAEGCEAAVAVAEMIAGALSVDARAACVAAPLRIAAPLCVADVAPFACCTAPREKRAREVDAEPHGAVVEEPRALLRARSVRPRGADTVPLLAAPQLRDGGVSGAASADSTPTGRTAAPRSTPAFSAASGSVPLPATPTATPGSGSTPSREAARGGIAAETRAVAAEVLPPVPHRKAREEHTKHEAVLQCCIDGTQCLGSSSVAEQTWCITPCRHVFCGPCYAEMQRVMAETGGAVRCPLCRSTLPSYDMARFFPSTRAVQSL